MVGYLLHPAVSLVAAELKVPEPKAVKAPL